MISLCDEAKRAV